MCYRYCRGLNYSANLWCLKMPANFTTRYAAVLLRLWIANRSRYQLHHPVFKFNYYLNLTDDKIFQAAAGQLPLVVFPQNGTDCWWSFFDIDNKDNDPIKEAANEKFAFELLEKLGAGGLLEKCGPGSYHVYRFYAKPQNIKRVIAYNAALSESFPHYAMFAPNHHDKFSLRLGPGARVPGYHHATGVPSQIWGKSRAKWVEYGTEEFIDELEKLDGDPNPILPEIEKTEREKSTGNACRNWKTIQGPKAWKALHLKALELEKQQPSVANFLRFQTHVTSLRGRITCTDCRKETDQYYYAHPLPNWDRPDLFFAWTMDFHNYVNEKLGKPTLSVDEARQVWG